MPVYRLNYYRTGVCFNFFWDFKISISKFFEEKPTQPSGFSSFSLIGLSCYGQNIRPEKLKCKSIVG